MLLFWLFVTGCTGATVVTGWTGWTGWVTGVGCCTTGWVGSATGPLSNSNVSISGSVVFFGLNKILFAASLTLISSSVRA